MLRASDLKKSDIIKNALTKELSSIYASVDADIKVAYDQGKKYCVCSVPITYNIPFMTCADAQRYIYYHVLKSLLDREFRAEMELKKEATLFHVTWLSKEEEDEIEQQNAILAKYTKK